MFAYNMRMMTVVPTSWSSFEDLNKVTHGKHLEQPLTYSKYPVSVSHSHYYELFYERRTVPSISRNMTMSETWLNL